MIKINNIDVKNVNDLKEIIEKDVRILREFEFKHITHFSLKNGTVK
jgi:hypothetical protein